MLRNELTYSDCYHLKRKNDDSAIFVVHTLIVLPIVFGHFLLFHNVQPVGFWVHASIKIKKTRQFKLLELLSCNGNFLRIKDNIDFHNFSQNAANFTNSKRPGPVHNQGCESPVG